MHIYIKFSIFLFILSFYVFFFFFFYFFFRIHYFLFNMRNNLRLILYSTDFIFHSVDSVILFLMSSLFDYGFIHDITFFSDLIKLPFISVFYPVPSFSWSIIISSLSFIVSWSLNSYVFYWKYSIYTIQVLFSLEFSVRLFQQYVPLLLCAC